MISIQGAVQIIVLLVVGGIIFWLLNMLVDKSPIPEPYRAVVKWVLLLLAILVLIGILLSFVTGTPVFRA